MNKILDVMEDIKQNITDNQYKIIMDSLMAINKDPIIYKDYRLIGQVLATLYENKMEARTCGVYCNKEAPKTKDELKSSITKKKFIKSSL
jgi:hypothetical protein